MREIEIIRENEDWMVLDKPPGVSVHNKKGMDLISFVKEKFPESDKAFLINRLDTSTCGLVLFAKHLASARILHQSLEKRELSKTYIAQVQLLKDPPEVGASGLWRWPLTNRAETRRDPKGYWGKRIPCQTEWQVLSLGDGTALLKINLLSGRKHQIRRHSAIHGWPILGDLRYGPEDAANVEGHHLIAKELSFTDPLSGENIKVISSYEPQI